MSMSLIAKYERRRLHAAKCPSGLQMWQEATLDQVGGRTVALTVTCPCGWFQWLLRKDTP